MITEGQFHASIVESVQFFKSSKLFKGRGAKKVGDHSYNSKKVAKYGRHTEIYATAIENNDYEIILIDDSIFQFSYSKDSLRFSFIQNPNVHSSKAEYLASIFEPDEFALLTQEEVSNLADAVNEEEYEQFLNEQEINLNANIIRYDMTELGYTPLIHSYSHFHIGLNPSIRIPCSKALTPFKFVLFSIKHTYYQEWLESFERDNNFSHIIRDCKNKCVDLSKEFWKTEESFELYLT